MADVTTHVARHSRHGLVCALEAFGFLVVPPVFKTGEIEHLGLAGSIPVRLRETRRHVTQVDPRRLIPRTDHLLALPAVQAARPRLGDDVVRRRFAMSRSRLGAAS